MAKAVIAVFKTQDAAVTAVDKFKDLGYDPKEISVVMKDMKAVGTITQGTGENIATGATSGAITGGAIGALAGLLIGIGAIAIPGIGGLLIGGPLAATLGLTGAAATTASGAVTGALAGGLLGALTGLGIPAEEAKVYEDEIRGGGVLLVVPARENRVDEVIDIYEGCNAHSIRQIDLPENT
ncbi:low temperature-induced protein [Candidatus Woesebacteria bacterium]|nr:low temperature-induced protein [Candidatus Woesebacteria bacterium]